MHQINIFHSNNKIIIDTKKISVQEKTIEWNIENVGQTFNPGENVKVSVLNELFVTVTILNDEHQEILVHVKRSKNSFGLEHLDVGFDSIDRKRGERYGGLIGDIQKQKIEKLLAVQKDDSVILRVHDRIIYGRYRRNSGMNECVLVSIKDVLRPNSVEDYVKFSF